MATRPESGTSALGFRSHSGWAVLVAVAGPAKEPAIVVRRRIELSRQTPRQPFHAAEHLPFGRAEALIHRATDEARRLADRAIADAMTELGAAGHEPVAAGVLRAAGRPLPELCFILASHALIHAAEGELFRDVLRDAAKARGLRITEVKDRELDERAVRSLRQTPEEVNCRLATWGKALGPPWTQDEKRAALVAWVALASRGR